MLHRTNLKLVVSFANADTLNQQPNYRTVGLELCISIIVQLSDLQNPVCLPLALKAKGNHTPVYTHKFSFALLDCILDFHGDCIIGITDKKRPLHGAIKSLSRLGCPYVTSAVAFVSEHCSTNHLQCGCSYMKPILLIGKTLDWNNSLKN